MRTHSNLLYLPIPVVIGLIFYLLWDFTIKDYLPTPQPKGYTAAVLGSVIDLPNVKKEKKPVLLHFFNPECPCSRFNIEHVKKLIERYRQNVNFYVVLLVENNFYDWQVIEQNLSLGVPYLLDASGKTAEKCGVYSTPQAVILTPEHELYYRGNYNRARYCTDKNSNFTQMALDSLLAGNPPPVFNISATRAYGCELPANEE